MDRERSTCVYEVSDQLLSTVVPLDPRRRLVFSFGSRL